MIRKAVAFVMAVLASLSLAAWYDRYYRWVDCFNELGRCFDPESQTVYLEQAGMVWMSFAVIFAALTVFFAWRSLR